jgi:hypothetical protein
MYKIVKITPPIVHFSHSGTLFNHSTKLSIGKMAHTQEFLHTHTVKPRKNPRQAHTMPHIGPHKRPTFAYKHPDFSTFLPLRRGDSGPKNCKIVSKNEKITPRPTPILFS